MINELKTKTNYQPNSSTHLMMIVMIIIRPRKENRERERERERERIGEKHLFFFVSLV